MSEPSPSEIEQREGGPVGREPERRREPVFNMPPVVLAVIGICVVVHLIRLYWLTEDQDFSLLIRTAFIPIRYS
ncbi:MAG: rhomboid family intramembrane serine protease, partial [Mesorhizobium sp.]